MIPEPPPGQSPIDPRGALVPPPPPGGFFPQPGDANAPVAGMNPPSTGVKPGVAGMNPPGGMNPPAGASTPSPGAFNSPTGAGMGSSRAYCPEPTGMGPPPGSPGGWRPFGPPPRRSWRGKGGWIALLLIALIASIALNVALSGIWDGSPDRVVESTLMAGDADERIAVIPIQGLIDENLENQVNQFLNHAAADKGVRAVVLLIDTPGGSVTASDELYKRIRKFKSDKQIPIVVAMRSMATSGGYYAACAADYITAERSTLTGNIGVLLPRLNVSRLLDKYGVQDTTLVAKGGTYKYAGSPFRPETDRDREYFQSLLDSDVATFKEVVAEGRKGKLKGNLDDIANGMAYLGPEALKLGLIDEIDETGYLDAAIKYAASRASLEKPDVVQYHDEPSYLQRLGIAKVSSSRPSKQGVNVHIDASLLNQLQSPRAMYLYRGPSNGDGK